MNDNLNDLVDFCESILNEDNIMCKNITNCILQKNEFNNYETTDLNNFEILNNLEKNKNKKNYKIEDNDTKKLISSEIPTELIDINYKLYYNQTIKDDYKSNLTDINENSDIKASNTTITKFFSNNIDQNTMCEINKNQNILYNLKIIINNIKQFPISTDFIFLFEILEHDLKNILRNAFIFLYYDNEHLEKIINKLEQSEQNDNKILLFIETLQKLLELNIKKDYFTEDDKFKKIDHIFFSKKYNTKMHVNVEKQLSNKIYYLKKKLKYENVTNSVILNYTINNINKITDKRIKQLFVLGLQNLMNSKSQQLNERLSYVAAFVYIFLHEKQFYNMKWYENFITVLCFSLDNKNYHTYNRKTINKYYIEDAFDKNQIYIAINSINNCADLLCYNNLKKNSLHFQNLKNLINALDFIKCKLYGIKF